MKILSGFGALAILTMFVLVDHGQVQAQEIRAIAGRAWSGHELLGASNGAGIEVGLPLFPRWKAVVGYESYRGTFRSYGSTCVGLVMPGENCAHELRHETAGMRSYRFAVSGLIAEPGPFRVEIAPGVKKSQIRSEQVGVESERVRAAQKTLYGFDMGFGVSYQPDVRVPLRLGVTVRGGFLTSLEDEMIVDGYSPFEDGTSTGELRAFVSFGR